MVSRKSISTATYNALKQAVIAFWESLLEAMKKMGYEKSAADPCMYFKWCKINGLMIWASWVDDNVCIANKFAIHEEKEKLKEHFNCEDIGEVKEYVGCKVDIDYNKRSVKFTQPVTIQSFIDEFGIKDNDKFPLTPAIPGSILTKGDQESVLDEKMHKNV